MKQSCLNYVISVNMWLELPDARHFKALNAINELTQLAWKWYKKWCNYLLSGRWKGSEYDECMLYLHAEKQRIAVFVKYVDDILLVGSYE